jgi:hypothetical protein
VIRGASLITLRTPPTFVADGLAPVDARTALPVGWVLLAAAALVALLGLSGLRIASTSGRRRRNHSAGADAGLSVTIKTCRIVRVLHPVGSI